MYMTTDTQLSGRTALVSGGSKGLGYAVAEALARHGADVAILARDEARLKNAESQLASVSEGSVLAVSGDVTDEGAVAGVLRQVTEWRGRLDIVVNAAHRGLQSAPLADTDPEVIQATSPPKQPREGSSSMAFPRA